MCRNSQLPEKLIQDFMRINSQHSCDVNEFDHVDPPFADLNPCNYGLRGLESRGELLLGKAGSLSAGYQGSA